MAVVDVLVDELSVMRPGVTVVPVTWAGVPVHAVLSEGQKLAGVVVTSANARRGLTLVSRFAPLAPGLLVLERTPRSTLDVMLSAAVLRVGVLDARTRTWLSYPEWEDDRSRNPRSLLLEVEARKAAGMASSH